MSRETTYTSIILKKQLYGEGDELITVFTRETGKLRVLAKAVKYSKSKLRHGLQALFLTKLSLTKSKFPKVIGVEVVNTFARVRSNLKTVKIAFYGLELLLKFTADEHKNEKLFNLYINFFEFLNSANIDAAKQRLGLAKFKMEFLQAMGLGVDDAGKNRKTIPAAFSNFRGGFLFTDHASDGAKISPKTFLQFMDLKRMSFEELLKKELKGDIGELQQILSGFIEYHLEREIKSERFLKD